MEPTQASTKLSWYRESEKVKISSADIYAVLKTFKDNDTFDIDHIALMCRAVSRKINDILEVPEDGEILYFDYDSRYGNSYAQADYLENRYSDRIVDLYEMRDTAGVLKQWRIVLRAST